MKHILLLLFISLFGIPEAQAVLQDGLDYSAEVGGQTYPLGGMLKGQGGYNWALWQSDNEGGERPWKFGYLRPYVDLQTAGIVNRAALGLEIYPISILGLSGGVGVSQRNTDHYQDFDCDQVLCDQTLNYQFAQARLILGYEKIALILTGKYEEFSTEEKAKPFYEEMSYLVGQNGGDDLKTLHALCVYEYSDTWSGGFLGIYQNFMATRSQSSSNFAIVNYTLEAWRGTVGLGEFRSTHQRADYAAVISLHYTGKKGLSLF